MAAIGGIFNRDGSLCFGKELFDMSRAMSVRGGYGRQAYINRCGGLIYGESAAERGHREHSPYTVTRGDKNITLVLDGDIFAEGMECLFGGHFFGESGGEFALECYERYGGDMAEHFTGDFALALYDESSLQMLLLRDGVGCRPLYYTWCDGRLCFASEIKGLLSVMSDHLWVDRERLREHIFAPLGSKQGLYADICEVSAGGGCILSRLGVAPFLYCNDIQRSEPPRRQVIREGFTCPDEEGLRRLLLEILYAFDYPQFDILMPTFIRDMLYLKDSGLEYSGALLDGTLCMDIGYSAERRDRLSVLGGVRPRCLPPDRAYARERDVKRLERTVLSLFAEADKEALRHIFGKGFESELLHQKNTAKRARVAAMMLQSVFWIENYNVSLR